MIKKIFILIILLTLVTGCGNYKEKVTYKKQAKENIINMFETKYGIKPKIEEVKPLKYFSEFGIGNYTGICEVTVKYNNKEYLALIDATTENIDGYDNYQYNQIYNDILKEISDINKTKPVSFMLRYDNIPETYKDKMYDYNELYHNGLISSYYDGTNIKDITTYMLMNITFDNSINYDENKLSDFINKYYKFNNENNNNKFQIVYFSNNDNYKKYMKYENTDYWEKNPDFYSPADEYIDFFILLSKDGKIEKHQNNVKDNINKTFMGWDINLNNYEIKETEPFDLNNIINYDESKYKIESNYYSINYLTDNSNCTESFKIKFNDNIKIDTTKKYVVALKAENCRGEINYFMENVSFDEVNNKLYLTKYVNYKNISFVILSINN